MTLLAGVTVGNFAFWADSLLVAVLLYYGANSFKRVTEVKCDNQLPYIFQVPEALKNPTFAKKGCRSYFIESGEVLGEARLQGKYCQLCLLDIRSQNICQPQTESTILCALPELAMHLVHTPLRHVQGLSRLTMVFTQFGVAALAVAVVHVLEAASRHPPITKVAAALFFAIAGEATQPPDIFPCCIVPECSLCGGISSLCSSAIHYPHCWQVHGIQQTGSRPLKAYVAMFHGLCAKLEEVHWRRAMSVLCRSQECCPVVDHVRQLIHRGRGGPRDAGQAAAGGPVRHAALGALCHAACRGPPARLQHPRPGQGVTSLTNIFWDATRDIVSSRFCVSCLASFPE